jgi:hypothetical protein
MSKDLRDQLEDFMKGEMKSSKKTKTFEEVFQATLDATTPTQPGDLRNERKWEDKPKEEMDEWI